MPKKQYFFKNLKPWQVWVGATVILVLILSLLGLYNAYQISVARNRASRITLSSALPPALLASSLFLLKTKKMSLYPNLSLPVRVVFCLGSMLLCCTAINAFATGSGYHGIFMLLEYIMVLGFALVLFSLTGSSFWASLVLICLGWLMGIVNHYKLLFNGMALIPGDIFAAGTAVNVLGDYTITVAFPAVLMTATCLMSILLVKRGEFRLQGIRQSFGKRGLCLGAGLLTLWACLFPVLQSTGEPKLNFSTSPQVGYARRGLFLGFTMEGLYNAEEIPDKYDAHALTPLITEALVASPSTVASAVVPKNIIVIMNESFADMQTGLGFETTVPLLPNYQAIAQRGLYGSVAVSVFGGGTSCSEFELLTGCTMAFSQAGAAPYAKYIITDEQNTPSMVSQLENAQFKTVSMHPAKGINWIRDVAYPKLGFSDSYFIDELQSFIQPDDLTYYERLSDAGCYRWIDHYIRTQVRNENVFIFCVTMQNHGGYVVEDMEGLELVHATGALRNSAISAYLTLQHESDKALGQLLAYVDALSEETLVLFFGDHWPRLSNANFHTLDIDKVLPSSLNNKPAFMYETPFVFFANYDIPTGDVGTLSANYLGSVLMDMAGVNKSDYFKLLAALRQQLPVVSAQGIYDAQGKKLTKVQALTEYPLLSLAAQAQYNLLLDPANRCNELFQ